MSPGPGVNGGGQSLRHLTALTIWPSVRGGTGEVESLLPKSDTPIAPYDPHMIQP
jgi:hypothetical protein